MAGPAKLYETIGRAAGCRDLAVAFYARVERDPVLRPLFPSTFTCAIEEFSAFLAQFLGGKGEHTQRRWRLSLRESHQRFSIGPRERTAWLRAMTATLDDESVIADPAARRELLEFFQHSSAHIVNNGQTPAPGAMSGQLAPLWDEQLAIDEVVALVRSPGHGERCLGLLRGPVLQARFTRSPAVHASVLALVATSGTSLLREYALAQIRANPTLAHERYKHSRTLLHDAAATGDVALVDLLLDLGAGEIPDDEDTRSPLYCVANECSAPGASQIVHALLQRSAADVNAIYGVKRCTALHMAARRGNVEVIGALLDGGANIEARDSVGDTPLRRAVNLNKVGAARLLLARGADPHSKGSRGLTPVRAARSEQMKRVFLRSKWSVVDPAL